MANKKEIDKEQFEKLCMLQCTKDEICAWFSVDENTITRWVKDTYGQEMSFSGVFKQKKGKGRVSLRRNQWKMSETNVAMAIWLGKQYLDQSDKAKVEQDNINMSVEEYYKRKRDERNKEKESGKEVKEESST